MGYEKNPSWQSGVAILEDNVFQRQDLIDEAAGTERRKQDRFNVAVPLTYRIHQHAGAWHSVMTQDISNTGIRLQMEDSPELGTKLDLDVLLPGAKRKIQIEGTVVWTRPIRYDENLIECGIAFQNLKKVTGKEKLLKFITDRLCLFALTNPPKKLHGQPADSLNDLKSAFSLIYKEYRTRGYCKPNAHEMHYSAYSMLPGSRTFVLKKDGLTLGTISLVPDSELGLPMQSVFPDIVERLRGEGRKLAEVSLLALDREAFQKKSFSLTDFQKMTGTFNLFKTLFDYVRLRTDITDLVIAVHPKHEDLYQYLTYRKIGPYRSYSAACGKPAVPMMLTVDNAQTTKEASEGLIRYFYLHPTPHVILDKKYEWRDEDLQELLVQKSNLWRELPREHQQTLQNNYPGFNPR